MALRLSIVALLVTAAAWGAWRPGAATPAAADAVAAATTPEALQRELLRRNLQQPGDPHLGVRYQQLNARHFGGTLPPVRVMWEPDMARVGELAGQRYTLEGMFGHEAGQSIILLASELQGDDRAVDRVLCHEMVHAYLHAIGKSSTGHGPEFQTVLQRLSIEGAFEGLVATHAERERLREWLDREAVRLDAEHAALDQLDAEMRVERADLERALAAAPQAPGLDAGAALSARRDDFNARATAAAARLDQLRRDREAFDAAANRYNLMQVYPDGLLDDSAPSTATGRPAAGGN